MYHYKLFYTTLDKMPDGDHIDLTIDVLHEWPYQARSYTNVLFGSRSFSWKDDWISAKMVAIFLPNKFTKTDVIDTALWFLGPRNAPYFKMERCSRSFQAEGKASSSNNCWRSKREEGPTLMKTHKKSEQEIYQAHKLFLDLNKWTLNTMGRISL